MNTIHRLIARFSNMMSPTGDSRDTSPRPDTGLAPATSRPRSEQRLVPSENLTEDVNEVSLSQHARRSQSVVVGSEERRPQRIEIEQLLQTLNKTRQEKDNLQVLYDECMETNVILQHSLAKVQQAKAHEKKKSQELAEELESYRSEWNTVWEILLMPYMNCRKSELSDAEQREWQLLANRILRETTELYSLRNSFHSLQQEMLSSVEKTRAISDEQLRQEFRALASAIKSISRSVPLGNLDKIDTMFNDYNPIRGVSNEYWIARPRKRCLIEAAIWSVLLDMVFRSPFHIFGEAGVRLSELWISVFGDSSQLIWPLASETCEAWRYTTVEQAISKASRDVVARGLLPLEHADTYFCHHSMSARTSVHRTIHGMIRVVWPDIAYSHLNSVIDKAFTLAVDMFTQRCRLNLSYPGIGQQYVIDVTNDMICIPDSEDVENGRVVFVVNPGLVKWGDAHGRNLDKKLDLVPALVHVEEYKQEAGTPVARAQNGMLHQNEQQMHVEPGVAQMNDRSRGHRGQLRQEQQGDVLMHDCPSGEDAMRISMK